MYACMYDRCIRNIIKLIFIYHILKYTTLYFIFLELERELLPCTGCFFPRGTRIGLHAYIYICSTGYTISGSQNMFRGESPAFL